MQNPKLVSPMEKFTWEKFALDRLAITTQSKSLMGWLRRQTHTRSLWPMPFGISCCALEYTAAMGPRYDMSQNGVDIQRYSPRQSDLMIVAGTVTEKMAPILRKIYQQMASPKWVIAMGACASSGGVYRAYNVVQGIGTIIPVDVYIPGCPPTPESLIQGIIKVRQRIKKGISALEVEGE